ncbi:MAG: pseudouridine synthase [Acidobacteriota bacterium]
MKLQKFLQNSGFGSRREVRKLITDKNFKINNVITADPNLEIDPETDSIKYGNKVISLKIEKKSYFIFNKPIGVISSLKDPEGRLSISNFIEKIKERVYPVGRLDYNSEGLILLTNDGDLTNFIISPKNSIPKIYLLKIKGILSQDLKGKMERKGVFLDGKRVKILKIDRVSRTKGNNSWIRVSIVEGQKHILRKMFKYSGHPVEKLRRVAIGNFSLRQLPSGHWRELTDEEIKRFKKLYNYQSEPSR